MSQKIFWQVDSESFCSPERERSPFKHSVASTTPREAAKKLASRGETSILLVEPHVWKVHAFSGRTRQLEEGEKNEYTRARNIERKPEVSKLFYYKASSIDEAREVISQNFW